MPLLADWKAAKANFEKSTGKKKPSDKFLGIFRRSSGLEDSLKALDAALDKMDLVAAEDALKAFAASSRTYVQNGNSATRTPRRPGRT